MFANLRKNGLVNTASGLCLEHYFNTSQTELLEFKNEIPEYFFNSQILCLNCIFVGCTYNLKKAKNAYFDQTLNLSTSFEITAKSAFRK